MCYSGGDPGVMSQTIDRLRSELAHAQKHLGPVDFYNSQMKILQDENKKLRKALIDCRSEARVHSDWHIIAIVDDVLENLKSLPKRKRARA